MIVDTVRLKFKYSLPSNNPYFKDSVKKRSLNLQVPSKSNESVYTNSSWRKSVTKAGFYVPKYWIERDYLCPSITYLIIEFSMGKLLFGENFTEKNRFDQNLFLEKIQNFLNIIKISIPNEKILNSIPLVLAFGKNVDFSSICSSDLAISILFHFNDRYRSEFRNIGFEKGGGKELYFSTSGSSFKVYQKIEEILANAKTKEEKKIVNLYAKASQDVYKKDKTLDVQILRFELTLRNKKAITQKFENASIKNLTLEIIFKNQNLLEQFLQKEVEDIYKVPLKNVVLLAFASHNIIDRFLNMKCKSTKKRAMIREILYLIQSKGLAKTKNDFIQEHSRRTWYNYLKVIKGIERNLGSNFISRLDSSKIIDFVLSEFKINNSIQLKFDF